MCYRSLKQTSIDEIDTRKRRNEKEEYRSQMTCQIQISSRKMLNHLVKYPLFANRTPKKTLISVLSQRIAYTDG